MNTIKRDVYVLRNTIKIPIEVTKGTDMVGIEFTVRDFDIPATAAAVAYSYSRKMKKPNSQLCDVKGDVISFTPGREFFSVGMNELQIRVINEDNNVSIRDIYSEYCNPVIYSYGCNGFSVNGFYSSNDYNFLELYNDAQIENGYFNVKSEFDIGIINLQNISKVIVNNVKTRNLSTGKVYIFKQEIANDSPLFGEIPFYEIESLPHRLRYTSDNFDFEFKTFDNKEKQFHCAYPSIIVVNDKELTALSNDEVKLYKNGIAVAKAVILKDDVLTKGKIYKMVRLLNNSDSYIYKNGDILEVKHNNTTGVDLEIIIRFTDIKYGEYYIS